MMNLEPEWVLKTIESLKMYKAPGPDGIPNDFYYPPFRRGGVVIVEC